MTVTCPRCLRSLSTADADGPPLFCMYCGQKLSTTPDAGATAATAAAMHTRSFVQTASGVDEDEVPVAPEPAPKVVGGYRLLRLLGAGGMGTVYEAEDPVTGNRVAVKLLSSRLASSPTSVERFRQEGRLASQITHPRCVFVLAADADGGRPYIVMELMPGQTLKDLVDRRGPLDPEEAVARILDVIDGLAEAHRVGMIHRDMKPSNCFLTADDRVKVGDFGLSKSLAGSRDRQLTQSGAFLGTVLFASPEQIRGEALDYGSDVYSVCATLYYLLCGQAPHHHENVTAVLAKAISEDPTPVGRKRPGVPRALEQVVMRGLERDRERRWQSLDDLREALLNLLPSRRHPARPRALVGAYVLDRILVGFLTVPVELVRQWATTTTGKVDVFEFRWASIGILLGYFALCEGLFGATVGKWVVGLRVSRPGRTTPPGVGRALVRAVVFHALLFSVLLVPEKLIEQFGPLTGGLLGVATFFVASALLLVQTGRRARFRGVQDRAAGTIVTQKPLPARKIRLPVKHPTLLQAVLPPAADPLPESVGGYAVGGRLAVEASGEQVWAAEDRILGRAVLLWLKPGSVPPKEPRPPEPARPVAEAVSGTFPALEVSRPTRLRRLGRGAVMWAGKSFEWAAFAAPLGGPLADAIRPGYRLPWADARLLLEQLVDELRAAAADGTTPTRLGLDQVWVEPNGRLQLLDCPLGVTAVGARPPAAPTPVALLREVASLALEGQPRSTRGGVLAPVPAHARPVLDRLFTDGGYPTLADLQHDLAETHTHRPEVTPAVRAAHLGLQAAVVGPALALMFALAAALGPFLTASAGVRAEQAEAALAALRDPEQRARLAAHPGLDGPVKHPRARERLEEYRDRKRAEADARRAALLGPQRFALAQFEAHAPPNPARAAGYPVEVREAVQWAGALDGTPRAQADSPWRSDAAGVLVLLFLMPVGLAVVAAVVRGGVSMLIAGVSVVRADGWRATRRQCAVRAVLVWFPVAGLLFGAAVVQAVAPERVYLAAGLWLVALALLPIYVVIALRLPDRPPQDRATGTYLVPA